MLQNLGNKHFRKEHVEKEIMEKVRLTGTIYVKPQISCAPTIKEIKICGQE